VPVNLIIYIAIIEIEIGKECERDRDRKRFQPTFKSDLPSEF